MVVVVLAVIDNSPGGSTFWALFGRGSCWVRLAGFAGRLTGWSGGRIVRCAALEHIDHRSSVMLRISCSVDARLTTCRSQSSTQFFRDRNEMELRHDSEERVAARREEMNNPANAQAFIHPFPSTYPNTLSR